MDSKLVFISHIHEEAPLALVLKDWIEGALPGSCTVFVSSDPSDIPAGTKWLEQIDTALQGSAAVLVLCSNHSIRRPWINFEAGCAWSRRLPIVPVCHSGLSKDSLPPPLASFQSIDLSGPAFSKLLLESLAKHLGIPRAPRIDFARMSAQLLKAVSNIQTPPSSDPPTAQPVADEIESEQVKILTLLSKSSDPIPAEMIRQRLGLSYQKTRYHLDNLLDLQLVDHALYVGGPAEYYLTKEGRKFLVTKDLL